MTGDFLTGTAGSESAQFLQEGKSAFAKQDWPKAIEAFKQALAVDPNQPEAHAYMGFILVQAGHADGALLAFEKALAVAPNLADGTVGKGDGTVSRQTRLCRSKGSIREAASDHPGRCGES